MDDATTECLSRYLDGDLAPDEERALEERIRAEPGLQSSLRALEEMRGSIRGIATAKQAPPDLDRVMEPLLRSAPPETTVRPWARWLATAAAVVLGVTVIMEVNRQGVGQKMTGNRAPRPAPVAEPTERFALAPLPTTSLPLEEQPVGVGDRLIASPIPDMVFDDSPALEVLGPLDSPPSDREKEDRERDQTGAIERRIEPESSRQSAELRAVAPSADLDSPKDESPVVFSDVAPVDVPDSMRAGKSADESTTNTVGRATQAQFYLFDESRTVWLDFEPTARCKHGRYAVRVRVEAGKVVEVWPVGAATSPAPQERLCAAGLVSGFDVSEVADGEYHAEVVIEPRAPGGS